MRPGAVHRHGLAFDARERVLDRPLNRRALACRCQPTNSVPSYWSVSLMVRTAQ